MKRRTFFRSLLGAVASLAIAQSIALSPVKVFPREIFTTSSEWCDFTTDDIYASFKEWNDGELVEESYFKNYQPVTKGETPEELLQLIYA